MKDETRIAHSGRAEATAEIEIVNPPVYRASTVLFPSAAALEDHTRPFTYGRHGTPTARALEAAVCALEGGARTSLAPSGLGAIAVALLAFLKSGDHVLLTDGCYRPTRRLADRLLKRYGVSSSYFDPLAGAGIAKLMKPETKVVFCESPSSITFEVQDLPAIAAAAHASGAMVVADNTWASPLYCKPLQLGCDISLQSATKYIAGHSDLLLGTISANNDKTAQRLVDTIADLGSAVSQDDAYACLRGLRTLAPRLVRHQANALQIAQWLARRPEVAQVLYPALPEHAGHTVWQRDFKGASGTFGVAFKQRARKPVAAFVDALSLFGIGYSFGGYESLVLPVEPAKQRSVTDPGKGWIVRLHIGLEDPGDLIADLEKGLAAMKAAS